MVVRARTNQPACASVCGGCRQGDGSAANGAYVDAEWAPLLNTPGHPEHPSGGLNSRWQWGHLALPAACAAAGSLSTKVCPFVPSSPTLQPSILPSPPWVPVLLLRCAGHSATAGAAAGALATYFGKDTLTFTIGTEYSGLAPRTYTSLSEVRRHRAVPGWRR